MSSTFQLSDDMNPNSPSGADIIHMSGRDDHSGDGFAENQEPSHSCSCTALMDPLSPGIFCAAFRHFRSITREPKRNNPLIFLRQYLEHYVYGYAFTVGTPIFEDLEGSADLPAIRDYIGVLEEPMRKPAFKSVLDKLETSKVAEETSTTCVVCMEMFEIDDETIKLECGHVYHKSCALQWFSLSYRCPSCRKELHSVIDVKLELTAMLNHNADSDAFFKIGMVTAQEITIWGRFPDTADFLVTLVFPIWKPKKIGNAVVAVLVE